MTSVIVRLLKLADLLDLKGLYKEANLINLAAKNAISIGLSLKPFVSLWESLGIIVEGATKEGCKLTFIQPTNIKWTGTVTMSDDRDEVRLIMRDAVSELQRELKVNLDNIKYLSVGKIYRFEKVGDKSMTRKEVELPILLGDEALTYEMNERNKAQIRNWLDTGTIKPIEKIEQIKTTEELLNDHNRFRSNLERGFQDYINKLTNEELKQLFQEVKIHGYELMKKKKELVAASTIVRFRNSLTDVSNWLTKLKDTYRLEPQDYDQQIDDFDTEALLILD